MNRTAWTATREELVRELARARTERLVAIHELHTARAEVATLRAHKARTNEVSRARRRSREVAEAIQELAAAQRLIESIQPDPKAEDHRRELIEALKEKSA